MCGALDYWWKHRLATTDPCSPKSAGTVSLIFGTLSPLARGQIKHPRQLTSRVSDKSMNSFGFVALLEQPISNSHATQLARGKLSAHSGG